ncbi:MAG: TetR/AcrR family transcriptional regulator [Anaerolineales bacterium]|nr:TetR/AcrR family transcriptional regulator [Anaerolineales bacterium]
MITSEWSQLQAHILELEKQGLVTRTFRRLDPARQQAVIQAILDEAAEKSPTALNIKQVAERAGVAVGSLYQYFGNRENLLGFAVELCVRQMTDLFAMSRPYLLEMPLREALTAYLTYGIEWSQTQQGFIQFFGRAAYQDDPGLADKVVEPVATAMRETVKDMLNAAFRRGEISPDLDLEAASRLVNGLMIVVGDSQLLPYLNHYFQITDETVPIERIVASMVDLIMNGIAPKQLPSTEGV